MAATSCFQVSSESCTQRLPNIRRGRAPGKRCAMAGVGTLEVVGRRLLTSLQEPLPEAGGWDCGAELPEQKFRAGLNSGWGFLQGRTVGTVYRSENQGSRRERERERERVCVCVRACAYACLCVCRGFLQH